MIHRIKCCLSNVSLGSAENIPATTSANSDRGTFAREGWMTSTAICLLESRGFLLNFRLFKRRRATAASVRAAAAAGVQAAAGVRAAVEMKFEQPLAMERFIYCYVSLI